MKKLILAITLGLSLTACGGADKKEKVEIPDIVKKAAEGDKAAMRELERRMAKIAKEEKKEMDAAAGDGDPAATFQKALMSGDGSEKRINALAGAGNPNAQLWMALNKRYDSDLSGADKRLYRTYLQTISRHGQNDKYISLTNPTWPLSAEAAFQISEDKLSAKWLFETDAEGAIKFLKQAAAEGQHKAMLKLSSRYEYGLGMDKDPAAARSWLEKSASAGNHDAKRALANLKGE
jgi:TPR repeat protein